MAAKIPRLKSEPKYTDAPRFPLIYKYEGAAKRRYLRVSVDMVKDLGSTMLNMISRDISDKS